MTLRSRLLLAALPLLAALVFVGPESFSRIRPAAAQAPAGTKTKAAATGAAATGAAAAPIDDKPVRDLIAAFTNAYNKAQADEIGKLITDDAALFDNDGSETRGREAIVNQYREGFGDGDNAQLAGSIDSLRLATADVASVSGLFELLGDDQSLVAAGRFHVLAVRKAGQWKIIEIRDESTELAPAPDNYDDLKPLEWLVGDWVDESNDVKLTTKVRWAEGRNFLVRTYTLQIGGAETSSGTQWIGWDPRIQQIHSWNFDSEGGVGEGLWTQFENVWVIKAGGFLRDGATTTATQIIEQVNKDAAKIRSYDRLVGPIKLPDIGEVIMVRQHPAPEAGLEEKALPAGAAGSVPATKPAGQK